MVGGSFGGIASLSDNIILIGFMGSGKTAVGKALAGELGLQFLDADELIVKAERMSIKEIFAVKGEPYFRDAETRLLKTLGDYESFVLSTGGGMVLRPENAKMLKELGTVVWLRVKPEVVLERLKGDSGRPLLNVKDPAEAVRKLLAQREESYRRAADEIIETSELSIPEVVEEIKSCRA